jgi:integrase
MREMDTPLSPECPFSAAAWTWLQSHRPYIRPSTFRVYKQYCNSLSAFFQELPLGQFHIGNVRSYQTTRKAGATRINAEVSALQMILKEVGGWEKIKSLYRPLPVPKRKVRQNMSEEEEKRLIACALDASKPKRLLAGHCLIVMANTSAGFGELRHLKRQDVHLDEDRPFIEVNEGTKNDYRIRLIPLNYLALRSMRWIVRRWEQLGGSEPEQYILPHHARRKAEEQAEISAAVR